MRHLIAGALAGALAVGTQLSAPSSAFIAYFYGAAAGALVLWVLMSIGRLLWRRRRDALPHWVELAVALTLVIAVGAHQRFAPPAPMVILLVVDCMRADLLNGDTAPQLTKLAATSWTFREARAHSSWTRSSMPSLLSSRLPAEHGLYRTTPPDKIRPEIVMISQVFDEAGWATAGFAEQAQLERVFGYGRGFQLYDPHVGDARALHRVAGLWNRFFRGGPRFLYLHYMDIHGPYTPEKRWLAKGLPQSRIPLRPGSKWRDAIRDIRHGRLAVSAGDWAFLRGQYDAEMRELDAELGKQLRAWERDGTLDEAWLVLTADHGEAFGEHGAIEHVSTPWDVLLRVPLLIRPPGGTEGLVIDDPVMLTDVMPTLFAAAGLNLPPEAYGRDLQPLVRGEKIKDLPGFAEERASKVQRVAVWWHGWKLLLELPGPDATPEHIKRATPVLAEPHLYHVLQDPHELTNLAPTMPEKVAELEGLMVAYERAVREKRRVQDVDWEAAARSGERWAPSAPTATAAADVSAETMRALEELGYVDGAEVE